MMEDTSTPGFILAKLLDWLQRPKHAMVSPCCSACWPPREPPNLQHPVLLAGGAEGIL
jgi:hypothetical protein